jgi:hypothetical protein
MLRLVLAAMLLFGASACQAREAREPLAARYGVVVTAMEPDADALDRLMDQFATAHALKIDVSPTTHSYVDAARTTMIDVDRMGSLGAVISLYSLTDGLSAYEEALRAQVEGVVAGRWKVRRCQDVEGFKGPWLYH